MVTTDRASRHIDELSPNDDQHFETERQHFFRSLSTIIIHLKTPELGVCSVEVLNKKIIVGLRIVPYPSAILKKLTKPHNWQPFETERQHFLLSLSINIIHLKTLEPRECSALEVLKMKIIAACPPAILKMVLTKTNGDRDREI